MSAAAASTLTGACTSATEGCTTIINIEVSVAPWGHLIFVHSPDVSVHRVEVVLLSFLPVVNHCVSLGNNVENAIGHRMNVVDSFSLVIVSTGFGIKNSAVVADLFVGSETRHFVLGFAFLHDNFELSSEAFLSEFTVGGELSIGSVSGAVVTYSSKAEIESLLRFGFFLIIEVDFAASSSRVAIEIVAFHFRFIFCYLDLFLIIFNNDMSLIVYIHLFSELRIS